MIIQTAKKNFHFISQKKKKEKFCILYIQLNFNYNHHHHRHQDEFLFFFVLQKKNLDKQTKNEMLGQQRKKSFYVKHGPEKSINMLSY